MSAASSASTNCRTHGMSFIEYETKIFGFAISELLIPLLDSAGKLPEVLFHVIQVDQVSLLEKDWHTRPGLEFSGGQAVEQAHDRDAFAPGGAQLGPNVWTLQGPRRQHHD